MRWFRQLSLFVIVLVFLGSARYHLSSAQQDDDGIDESAGETLVTNPKSRTVTVSATVADTIPPSVPILVSPTNGSTITTTLPTFIWQPSTDEQGIGKYQLYLDGSLLFDNIPTSNTTNSSYTLIFEDGEYKLTVKSALSQGSHTWRIVAHDVNTNSTTSATWTFSIDTVAPTTVVTAIGSITTSISSADSGSVPTTPIQLPENEPAISGTSENGATLTLTLTVPGEGTSVYTTTVSGSTFSFQLGTLPTNTTITFTIVSVDAQGNSSTISDVPFTILPFVIILPTIPPPTPSPTPEGQTPAPTEVGAQATPLPSPTGTPFAIAVPRPTEATKFAQEFLEDIITLPIVSQLSQALPALSLLAPVLVTVATATQTGSSFLYPLIELITKLLQAIGLIPKRKARGVVFDSKNGSAVAFATVNIYGKSMVEIIDSVVSDEYGIYNSITLARGTYRLEAIHSEYHFPTQVPRSPLTPIEDFYKGEDVIVSSEEEEQFFLIPMDPLKVLERPRDRAQTRRLILTVISRISRRLFIPMAVVSFVVTLVFPTIWNILICGLYAILFVWYALDKRQKPQWTITCQDPAKTPLPGVVVRITTQETGTLVAIRISDANGEVSLRLPAGKYACSATKAGYLLTENGNPIDLAYRTITSSMADTWMMVPPEQL